MSTLTDSLGIAGAGKYGYQAGRAARGLGTTTALTAGLDLASGTAGVNAAGDVAETVKSLSTTTKGVSGAAKLSPLARISRFAGRVAPAIGKGAAVLGVALGGYQVGKGINSIRNGETEKGRDQVISGTADVITSGALGVAAVASGTVVGMPVAAVALGVAGVSQGAKYAWKYRENIGDAGRAVGRAVGNVASSAASAVSSAASDISNSVRGGLSRLGNALWGSAPRTQPALGFSSTA